MQISKRLVCIIFLITIAAIIFIHAGWEATQPTHPEFYLLCKSNDYS